MALAVGTKLGRYEIRSKIGEGGMGEVYLAQDTELDRPVALKILPAELTSNPEPMRRFTQEAKAAAALNHPNIAHVYEVGETGGQCFIAMEFVEGVTLREKIHREKTDPIKLLRQFTRVWGTWIKPLSGSKRIFRLVLVGWRESDGCHISSPFAATRAMPTCGGEGDSSRNLGTRGLVTALM